MSLSYLVRYGAPHLPDLIWNDLLSNGIGGQPSLVGARAAETTDDRGRFDDESR